MSCGGPYPHGRVGGRRHPGRRHRFRRTVAAMLLFPGAAALTPASGTQLSTGASDDDGGPVLLSGVAVSEFSRPGETTFHADWSPRRQVDRLGRHGRRQLRHLDRTGRRGRAHSPDRRSGVGPGPQMVSGRPETALRLQPQRRLESVDHRAVPVAKETGADHRRRRRPRTTACAPGQLVARRARDRFRLPGGRNRELWVIPAGGGEKRQAPPGRVLRFRPRLVTRRKMDRLQFRPRRVERDLGGSRVRRRGAQGSHPCNRRATTPAGLPAAAGSPSARKERGISSCGAAPFAGGVSGATDLLGRLAYGPALVG